MSANISGMMYTGETPWHGLGTKLEKAATAAEAITAAGLDWAVTKEPAFYQGADGGFRAIPEKFATVRGDNGAALGIVGPQFTPLQNKEAFSFFDAVVGIKEAIYHTAGSLGQGEKVWILAKLDGIVRVVGDDVTEKYLLLSNGHDGSAAVTMMFTPIRVVCQNTLNIALRGEAAKFKARHTVNLGLKVEDVREQLGIVNAQFAMFEEAAKRLAAVQVTQEALKAYVLKTVIKAEPGKDLSTRAKNIMEEVSGLFEKGRGNDMKGVKGTAWAAFNAVAEYVDYNRGANAETRANQLLFGAGATMKQKAWDEALVLAK